MRGNKYSKYRRDGDSLFEGGDDAEVPIMEPVAGEPEGAVADDDGTYAMEAIERQKKFNEILVARREKQAKENPDMNPDSAQGPLRSAATYRLCTRFWLKFVIFFLIIALGQISKGSAVDCGIDPISWVQGYFAILLLLAIFEVMIFFFLKCSCSTGCIATYYGVFTIIGFLLLIVWIIMGYGIYFSAENECQKSPDQFGWLVLMVILLFFGIFMIIGFSIMLCFLCCLACFISSHPGGELTQNPLTSGHAAGGVNAFYDPSLHSFSNKCTICQDEYKPDDKLLVLGCDDKHYFHDECLTKMVENGGFKCPLCNEPIQ